MPEYNEEVLVTDGIERVEIAVYDYSGGKGYWIGIYQDSGIAGYDPTHWMPLPEPPKEK